MGKPAKPQLHPIVKVAVADLYNSAAVADTDILGTSIEPTDSPAKFVIQVQYSAAAVLNVMATDGTTEHDLELNKGGALTASALYTFEVLVERGFSYNFEFSANGTIEYFTVYEVGLTD